jgi:predicted MPP superfamily phosphohydrolase
METLLRWIHISDIHMGHGGVPGRWDQELVLSHLRRDVERQLKAQPDPPVDLVFVTGDIANTGGSVRADEYEKADEWIASVAAAAGVARRQVFVVPGNHDVDRGADTRDKATGDLVTALRAGTPALDVALGEPAQRALLEKRMERYLAFARAFAQPSDGDALAWSHRFIAKSGLPVRLVGLNTSLLAADDTDQGKLRLGLGQLTEALRGVSDEELVLALGHHPSTGGWLADQAKLEGYLKGNVHALLTGHVHLSDAEQTRSGAGTTFLRVVAGSAHGDALPPGVPAGHGYNFGAVVRGASGGASVRIWPRRWVEKDGEFRIDQDSTPEGAAFSEHPLPSRLELPAAVALVAARPAARGVVAVPDVPVPVLISAAREDDDLRKALEKHLATLRRPHQTGKPARAAFTCSLDAPPGSEKTWLAERIEEARVILLLISQDYVGSDEYFEDQILRAVDRHDEGKARVIPVLARRYAISTEPFAKLQAIPRDGKAVGDYDKDHRDAPLAGIAREVRKVIYEMRGEPLPPER